MNNFEQLLDSLDADQLLIELDTQISELCAYGDALTKLTPAQQIFYFNQCFERELNNGGFNQYFYNSSGNYAHETIAALTTIGANNMAGILQKAIAAFPNAQVPTNWEQRQDVVLEIEEEANELWEALDQEFYAYPDNLVELNYNYVLANKQQFSF